MKELSLNLTTKELEQLNYEKDTVKNIIISRAIYNESLNYEFTNDELLAMKKYEETETVRLYTRKLVEPKLMINENQIIEAYNKNKEFFETNKISFKDAREMVKVELTKQQSYELEQEVVREVVINMPETVSIKKEDILYTNGDGETLKQMIINTLLLAEANKTDFFNENKEQLELIKQEIRMNFFVRIFNSKDIKVSEEEVVNYYKENTEKYKDIDTKEAYNSIFNDMREAKLNINVSNYVEKINKKYNIDSVVEDQIKKAVIN